LIGLQSSGAYAGQTPCPSVEGRWSYCELQRNREFRAEYERRQCSAAIWIGSRIASPEMFPEAEMLPHLICSRPIFIGGANDEADQHGGA
jgi:hypothetical protein